MSIYRVFLGMIRRGLAGLWKDLSITWQNQAHRTALKVWAATWFAGALSIGAFMAPWPINAVVALAAAIMDIFALRTVYYAATWFYLKGRKDEAHGRPKRKPVSETATRT